MASFDYLALDSEGKEIRGQTEAGSETALEAILRQQGRWLVEARAGKAATRGRNRRDRSVKRRVLIEFFLQLGMQLKAGIPIVSALGVGAQTAGQPQMLAIQQDLLDHVKNGQPLSEAMAAHPRAFGALVINLVRSAEVSGRLAEACYQIRGYYEWIDRLAGDVRRALMYPMFVLIAALMFVMLMFTFVVPKFTSLFAQLKIPLPTITTIVSEISHVLVKYGWLMVVGLFAIAVAWVLASRISSGFVRFRDALLLRVPLVGDLVELICVSRFTQNLSVLFGAGIPLLVALRHGRDLAGNVILEEAIDDVIGGVREGRKMHECMVRHAIFAPLVVRMVEVGEASGTLTEGLNNVAEYYQERLSRLIKKRLALLEPILIVLLIGVVGMVAVALVLPMAELMNPR